MIKISSILKKATFPAIMTIISFVLFLGLYYVVVFETIGQYYIKGLIFATPFIAFLIIAVLTARDKIKISVSSVITWVLIPVLAFIMMSYSVFMIADAATSGIEDVSKYERVINESGYPENKLISFFPAKIPKDATDVKFHYNIAFLQGGESFVLKYKTTSGDIQAYIDEFSSKAEWFGTRQDGYEQDSIVGWNTDYLYDDEPELPEDFIVYLLYSRPYQENDWNHGEVCLVAISAERNEIIFNTEDW